MTLKRKVKTTYAAPTKTVQPRTKPAILLMMKLQRPAPYFANALLGEVIPSLLSTTATLDLLLFDLLYSSLHRFSWLQLVIPHLSFQLRLFHRYSHRLYIEVQPS